MISRVAKDSTVLSCKVTQFENYSREEPKRLQGLIFFIMILIQEEVAPKRFNLCIPRWILVSWK